MIRVLQGAGDSGAFRGTRILACAVPAHAEPRRPHNAVRFEILAGPESSPRATLLQRIPVRSLRSLPEPGEVERVRLSMDFFAPDPGNHWRRTRRFAIKSDS